MGLDHFYLIAIQVLIFQVLTSYAQYVQYAGAPYSLPAYVTSYPIQSYTPSAPVYTQQFSQPVAYQPASVPHKAPAKPVPAYVQGSTPTHVPVPLPPPVNQACQTPQLQQPVKTTAVTPDSPIPPKAARKTEILPDTTITKDRPAPAPFDSNVLNNLAIALQLLIVSNLIHNPPPEPNPALAIDDDVFPEIAPLPIAYIPPTFPDPISYSNQHIPNANFLGTSSFADTGISKSMMSAYGSPTLPAARPSGLMSPYDAIGPNSPYFDYFKPKPEPKSPYHLNSDYNDLFSLTELFKV